MEPKTHSTMSAVVQEVQLAGFRIRVIIATAVPAQNETQRSAVQSSSPIIMRKPLLEAHHVLNPAHKVPEPRPIGSLCELSLQIGVVCRVAGGLHDVLAQSVLLCERVVHEQVGGVGFAVAVDLGWRAGLNSRAEEVLEVALLRTQAVEGPVGEEASVVVGDLLARHCD